MSGRPPPTAILLVCGGIGIFAGMDAVMKAQSIAIGALSAMFWRSVFGVVMTVPFALAARIRPTRKAIRLHLIRGTVAGSSIVLFFWGLARVPMAQAIALTFIAPLVALFLAAVFLKERVRREAVVASIIGLAGVLVIVGGGMTAGGGADATRGQAAILLGAVLYAGQLVLLRRQAQSAGPLEVSVFTHLVFLALYAALSPLGLRMPVGAGWGWLAFAAILSTTSLLAVAAAYARAEASVLAPFEYTAFLWAALLGWVVFGEAVGRVTLVGAGLIVIASLLAARRRPPVAMG